MKKKQKATEILKISDKKRNKRVFFLLECVCLYTIYVYIDAKEIGAKYTHAITDYYTQTQTEIRFL